MAHPSHSQSAHRRAQDSMPSPPLDSQSTTSGLRFVPYASHHRVTKGRYITSNDPRGYVPVYEYPLNGNWIMMDSDDGFILWTGIWKALGNSKADIIKMVENEPELASQLRRVRGGYLKIQGTWLPYDVALRLARRVAWTIRDDLVPLFGPTFPNSCLSPDQPGFGQVGPATRRKPRRTQPTLSADVVAPLPPEPGPSRQQRLPESGSSRHHHFPDSGSSRQQHVPQLHPAPPSRHFSSHQFPAYYGRDPTPSSAYQASPANHYPDPPYSHHTSSPDPHSAVANYPPSPHRDRPLRSRYSPYPPPHNTSTGAGGSHHPAPETGPPLLPSRRLSDSTSREAMPSRAVHLPPIAARPGGWQSSHGNMLPPMITDRGPGDSAAVLRRLKLDDEDPSAYEAQHYRHRSLSAPPPHASPSGHEQPPWTPNSSIHPSGHDNMPPSWRRDADEAGPDRHPLHRSSVPSLTRDEGSDQHSPSMPNTPWSADVAQRPYPSPHLSSLHSATVSEPRSPALRQDRRTDSRAGGRSSDTGESRQSNSLDLPRPQESKISHRGARRPW